MICFEKRRLCVNGGSSHSVGSAYPCVPRGLHLAASALEADESCAPDMSWIVIFAVPRKNYVAC